MVRRALRRRDLGRLRARARRDALAHRLLAAIPFLAQLAQVRAIALIERLRERRKIAVTAVSISRFMIAGLRWWADPRPAGCA